MKKFTESSMPPTKPQPTNNQWPNGVIRGPNILSALSLPMEIHGGDDFETIFPVCFRKKILGNGYHRILWFSLFLPNVPFNFQVSFCKTKVIIFEAPLSACFFPRLGNACDVEGRCKIVNLPLFCQRCTNMIANRLNLCFTAPPLPGFLILVISYDRENRCLLQYRLSLGLTGTFHIGWGSIQFFIFFSCWIVTSPKCRNFIK